MDLPSQSSPSLPATIQSAHDRYTIRLCAYIAVASGVGRTASLAVGESLQIAGSQAVALDPTSLDDGAGDKLFPGASPAMARQMTAADGETALFVMCLTRPRTISRQPNLTLNPVMSLCPIQQDCVRGKRVSLHEPIAIASLYDTALQEFEANLKHASSSNTRTQFYIQCTHCSSAFFGMNAVRHVGGVTLELSAIVVRANMRDIQSVPAPDISDKIVGRV